jgi:hypothetical protein
MTFPEDQDRAFEERLRGALHGEADMIQPAGDGLARIQQRVGSRSTRQVWLRPLAAVGALAVVAGAGIGAYALTRPASQPDSVLTGPTNEPVTPLASVTPTARNTSKPVTTSFPRTAIYPFTSAAAEQSWEASNGPAKQSWMLSPTSQAQLFIADFVQEPAVALVVSSNETGKTATVTLGRTFTDAGSDHVVSVTTVHLVRFGKAWLVTDAVDPARQLSITSPAAGTTVTSPLTVSGPQYGVDEAIQVDVRSMSGRDTIGSSAQASFGQGTPPWSTSLSFAVPQDPRGAVVATEASAADGGPAKIVATPVSFSAATLVDYPKYFYGVKNGRVAQMSSRNGASMHYLTAPAPGGGASDPQRVADTVYYLAGAGTCSNALMAVPTAGGASTHIADPQSGYVITSYAVSSDAHRLALFETSCDSGGAQPQGLLVSSVQGTTQTHSITFPSFPPTIVGDPAWEADGSHVDAIYRTGNAANSVRYDAFGASSSGDNTNACTARSDTSGLPTTVQVDGTGATWIGVQTGDVMDVLRCVGDSVTTMFAVPENSTPADLSVTSNGDTALVTDATGHVWRWNRGASAPTELTAAVPQTAGISW